MVFNILLTQFLKFYYPIFKIHRYLGFPGGSVGKESACNVGDLVRSLGWDDPQKGKATHSSILAGEFHGRYSPRGCKELDKTEQLSLYYSLLLLLLSRFSRV